MKRLTVVTVLVGVFLTGCATTSTTPTDTSSASNTITTPVPSSSAVSTQDGSVKAMLNDLEVKGRGPQTGYTRDAFGDGWQDLNNDSCDTRDEILKRDLVELTYKNRCQPATGVLYDKYTGKRIDFVRGVKTSLAVQIDHIVPLADAWVKNASRWDGTKRVAFANDPLNLMATDGPTNGAKSASDAASWLPPNTAFRCEYVSLQIKVKHKYQVSVTPAEKTTLTTVLDSCR